MIPLVARVAVISAITLLAGCGSIQRIETAQERVRADTDQATDALHALKDGGPPERKYLTVIADKQYVSALRVTPVAEQVPACNIAFAPTPPMTLLQFGQQVSKLCGVVVRITTDAISAVESASQAVGVGSIDGLPPPSALAGLNNASAGSRVVDTRFSGDVSALLSAVTTRLGLSWRYRDAVVTIYYLDTRNYAIYSIPTRNRMQSVVTSGTTTSAGISGSGSGGSSSGGSGGSGGVSGESGSTQTTTVSMDANISEDLPKAIASMLTPGVGRMFLASSTQTLTVTDTPEALDRIGTYIDALNRFATKAVKLNVKVVNVSTSNADELGLNWEAVYRDIANSYSVGLAGGFTGTPDAISGSVNILDGSRFNGSQLIVSALAKQGSVSIVTEPSVTTLNMESVPIQVARQTSFLASTQISQTANVGTTAALTPGTVTTGFNMVLLPYILPDDETILLAYSVNLSALDNIRRVESAGSAIEIPEVNNRIFSQKVRIKTGQTLVLSGFEQSNDNVDKSGVGNPGFFALGGGSRHTNQRDVLVVMITPIVQEAMR